MSGSREQDATQAATPWESFPKAEPAQGGREDERKGRALTTVNRDDFGIKPAPKAPEAD